MNDFVVCPHIPHMSECFSTDKQQGYYLKEMATYNKSNIICRQVSNLIQTGAGDQQDCGLERRRNQHQSGQHWGEVVIRSELRWDSQHIVIPSRISREFLLYREECFSNLQNLSTLFQSPVLFLFLLPSLVSFVREQWRKKAWTT